MAKSKATRKKSPKVSKKQKENTKVSKKPKSTAKKIAKPALIEHISEKETISASTAKTNKTAKAGKIQQVESGDTISVDYTASLEDGTVFDTSIESKATEANLPPRQEYAPMTFTAGSGQMIKGFDHAVIGMKPNETKTVTIPPEDAYGKKDPKKIITIPVSALVHQGIKPEKNVVLSTNIGHGIIVEIKKDNAKVDFNHALIGKTLKFEITLRSIKK